MKTFLVTANPYKNQDPVGWLISNSKTGEPVCTDDPDIADIIIFVEGHHANDPYYQTVLNHHLYKKYPHKCVLYHDRDLTITPIPTISPSIESWQYNPKHKRSFHYVARVCQNDTINQSEPNYDIEREYLYSFIGSLTHTIRLKILNLKHPSDTYIKVTSSIQAWELTDAEKIRYEKEYFEVSNKSFFILAPRGVGPCTHRLFESMQLGRVSVIISDKWVRIPNIDWDKFTITIPESKVQFIPEILRERKNEAIEMGRLARKYWEEYFSPEVSLYEISKAAQELLKHKYSFRDALIDRSQFFRSQWHLKNLLRFKKNQIKKRLLEKKH